MVNGPKRKRARAEETRYVLGTPLLITDYEQLSLRCAEWAREEGTAAVDFSNTHIITSRRHNPGFKQVTSCMDVFVPDGMPLVWCLNQQNAGLRDRVYGPTFMRYFLEGHGASLTHYFIGGTEECGQRLRASFPKIQIVGSNHEKCLFDGHLAGSAEAKVRQELELLKPDCIWVGLGTPKQYAWIERHKPMLSKGVLFAVGFAFDVNAGMKPDAPKWMQKAGLTWLFRLASEPRRLGRRYLKYNTLFLRYLLSEGLRGRAFGR